jgi:hypothetical protein
MLYKAWDEDAATCRKANGDLPAEMYQGYGTDVSTLSRGQRNVVLMVHGSQKMSKPKQAKTAKRNTERLCLSKKKRENNLREA